jgi:hypothetical protein
VPTPARPTSPLLPFGADANDVPGQAEPLERADGLPTEVELAAAQTVERRGRKGMVVVVQRLAERGEREPAHVGGPVRCLEAAASVEVADRVDAERCLVQQEASRIKDVVKKVDENLVPRLSKLPGFGGYHVIDAGDGVLSSIGFFDTSAQADESTRVASDWLRDEKLEAALPKPPKITSGEVVVHKARELAHA